jgi:hypothetical protein
MPEPIQLYKAPLQVEQPKKLKGEKIFEAIAVGAPVAAPIVQGIIQSNQAGQSAASSGSTAPPSALCENPAFAPTYAKWEQDVRKGQSGIYVTDPNTPDNRFVARFIPCPKK